MGQELPHQAEHIADMAIEHMRKARGKMKARTLQSIRGSIAWKEFCKEPEDVRGRFLSKAMQTRLQTRGVVQERQRNGRFKNVMLEDEGHRSQQLRRHGRRGPRQGAARRGSERKNNATQS